MKNKPPFLLILLVVFGISISLSNQLSLFADLQKINGVDSLDSLKTRIAIQNNPATDPGPGKEAHGKNWVSEIITGQENISIIAGNSRVVRFDRYISRIAVSDPEVADVLILDTHELLINAKKRGAVNLIAWDAEGNIFIYNLTISADPTPLKNALQSIQQDGTTEVFPTDKGFVVKGNVQTVEAQNQIASTAKAFADDSISLVTVEQAKQILLEIRFIEVDRNTGFTFGIDGEYIGEKVGFTFLGGGTGAALAADGVTTGLAHVAKSSNNFPALDTTNAKTLATGGFTDSSHNVQTFLKALEEKNILKIIARPNLLVRDGEKASFLVGGEFPVPIVTQNTVNVTFKEFGTRLIYHPEILKDDRVRLSVETEVSQLDFANGVTVSNFLIPALVSRRAVTVVELKNDYSLVIGGLIQQRILSNESGTPYLRRIPLLGKLFESTKKDVSDIELLVVITPHVIDPKKEMFKLNQLRIDDPRHTALAPENPPFEDDRALALETVNHRFEKDRVGKYVAEDRKLLRDKLTKEYQERKIKARNERLQELADDAKSKKNKK